MSSQGYPHHQQHQQHPRLSDTPPPQIFYNRQTVTPRASFPSTTSDLRMYSNNSQSASSSALGLGSMGMPPGPSGSQQQPRISDNPVYLQRPEDNLRPQPPVRNNSILGEPDVPSTQNTNGRNGGNKKRSRGESVSQADNAPSSSSAETGDNPKNNRGQAKTDADGKEFPAVLVREKKQKACSNCRKAKLKCIVETGEKDCVRCKARSERCVFYPRAHDEDWQQTLTADVYSALSHLSNLSTAVHHLLFHLSAQKIIPPFRNEYGDSLEVYDLPDRDMAVLQGWGAEKSRDAEKAGKRRRKEDGGEDEMIPELYEDAGGPNGKARRSSSISALGFPPGAGGISRGPRISMDRIPIPPPPNGWVAPSVVTAPLPMPNTVPQSHLELAPFLLDHARQNSGPQDLAPLQPHGRAGQVQLTPSSSDLDLIPAPYHPANISPAQPLNRSVMSYAPTMPLSNIVSPNQHVTPTSLPSTSSPAMANPEASSFSSQMQRGGRVSASVSSQGEPMFNNPIQQDEAYIDDGIPEGTIIGSKDNREDVIKKGIVTPSDAITLVSYFHRHLAPFLFGYQLRFGHFPYLPEGPEAITPLIFGVLCLLSSERLPHLRHLHAPLAQHVTDLLLSNPAESWFSLADAKRSSAKTQMIGGMESAEVKGSKETTGQGEDDEADKLDPELGIGPEEIVGAMVVSLFMSARGQAAQIAESAFGWARGWIKMLQGPPRNSVAELMAFVPAERMASRADMARVWLLCYAVHGLSVIMGDDGRRASEAGFDPEEHCHTLVPSVPDPEYRPLASDLVLTAHARLVHLLRVWDHTRTTILNNSPPGSISNEVAKGMHKLTKQTNSNLDWWHEDLGNHNLSWNDTRQIWLFWHFAKVLVNDKGGQALIGQPRFRNECIRDSVDGAMGFFEICTKWEPKEDITNIPQCYLNMIGSLAVTLREAVEKQMLRIDPVVVIGMLRNVGNMLSLGGLPKFHAARYSGEACLQAADQLARIVGI